MDTPLANQNRASVGAVGTRPLRKQLTTVDTGSLLLLGICLVMTLGGQHGRADTETEALPVSFLGAPNKTLWLKIAAG